MSYNGFEIFFQNLGNADSIFVRHWTDGVPTNILIDGGWSSSADQVEEFLSDRAKESGVSTIHHLVCSHSDDDHAGGLVEIVERENFDIEQAWVHDTRAAHAVITPERTFYMEKSGANRTLSTIKKSEATRHALLNALDDQGIGNVSPFTGQWIGPMLLLGPTPEFFDAQFSKLVDAEFIKEMEARLSKRAADKITELFESDEYLNKMAAKEDQDKPLGGDPTSPQNEVSTVIALPWTQDEKRYIYLFTGDVGRAGLGDVISRENEHLKGLAWMQVPHHGSRRSMTPEIINHLAPRKSFISCEGSRKHPSNKLVNALKEHGKVFSTHYSVSKGSWLRHHRGDVPALSTTTAVPLYDKG
jgi:beta-lactamase superfamily II metal-dependent hydrolase